VVIGFSSNGFICSIVTLWCTSLSLLVFNPGITLHNHYLQQQHDADWMRHVSDKARHCLCFILTNIPRQQHTWPWIARHRMKHVIAHHAELMRRGFAYSALMRHVTAWGAALLKGRHSLMLDLTILTLWRASSHEARHWQYDYSIISAAAHESLRRVFVWRASSHEARHWQYDYSIISAAAHESLRRVFVWRASLLIRCLSTRVFGMTFQS
jgi:hypothetical protein